MTQINAWRMTGNADTSDKGPERGGMQETGQDSRGTRPLTARTREHVEAEIPSGDAGFVTAASETEAYTMSQEFFNADSNRPGDSDESESSIEDPVDFILSARHYGKQAKRQDTHGSDAMPMFLAVPVPAMLEYEAGLDVSGKTIKRHRGTMDYHECLACRKAWYNEKTKAKRVEVCEIWKIIS